MANEPNFVAEAFKRQENLISLAGFGAAGVLFNPGFLLLAGAMEIVYLWMVSTNPRFHRVILSEKNSVSQRIGEDKKLKLISALPSRDRERFNALAAIRNNVFSAWQSRDPVTQSILQPSVEKLDYLLEAFLRTQVTLNAMLEHLLASEKHKIQKQAQELKGEIAGKLPEKLRSLKSQNLDLLNQRLTRLDKLEEDMDVVRTQLDTIESAVKFIADQSVALSDPQEITSQIDRTVMEVGETEKSIQDVEFFMGNESEAEKKQKAQRAQAQGGGQ